MEASAPIHMLDGYKVLDFTQAVAGPTATLMGAEVIKVELMPNGDLTRVTPISQVILDTVFGAHRCLLALPEIWI